jgi:hypothetical protein
MERSYRLRDNRYPEKGKEHPIEKPSELHKHIFGWLDPFHNFKYLDLRWLVYLNRGEGESLKSRQIYVSKQCGLLYQSPNFYLDRHPDQNYSVAKFRRPAVYNLDTKGTHHLGRPYREAYHRSQSYPHEFMVDMAFYAPLLSAVVEHYPVLDIINTWHLFNGHPLFPEKTRNAEKPFNFKVGDDVVKLDGRPIVLTRTKNERKEAICIPGIQVELCTKQVRESRNPNKASVGKHLRHVIEMKEQGLFEQQYGFDRVVVPFIFASKDGLKAAQSEMLNAMVYVHNELKKSPRFIIFKAMEYFPQMEDYPKPSPDLFLSPWLTVDGKEFRFDDAAFFRN